MYFLYISFKMIFLIYVKHNQNNNYYGTYRVVNFHALFIFISTISESANFINFIDFYPLREFIRLFTRNISTIYINKILIYTIHYKHKFILQAQIEME